MLTPLDKEQETKGEIITVSINSIENFCSQNNVSKIDFLKIDVEGYELNVLKGAENLLKEKKVEYLLLEITFYNRPGGHPWCNFFDIYNYLSLFEYRLVTIYTQAINENGYIFGDALFCKPPEPGFNMFSRSPFSL